MTPLDALAAAVRDRLLAGATAPLPGLGTLARAHVSARIRVGPDGSRVLLPPGEAVGLSARTADPAEIARALARRSGAPDEAGAGLLRDAVDQLEARLAITGEARLAGVGVFERSSGGVRFGVVPELLTAVNRTYEGLPPISVSPLQAAPEAPAEPPSRPPEAPVAATVPETRPNAPPPRPAPPPKPLEAVDILLDLIVNEPSEAPAAASPTHAPGEAPPAEPAPSESAFLDDPAEADPVLAVPFGTGDVSLRDVLPPTPPERDPGLEAPPHDAPAEPTDASPPAAPTADADHSALPFPDTAATDAPAVEHDPPSEAPWEPPVRGVPDGPSLSDPPRSPGAAPAAGAAPAPAVKRRSHFAGWLLYTAVVLSIAALLLWWTAEERRADPPPTAQKALALRPL